MWNPRRTTGLLLGVGLLCLLNPAVGVAQGSGSSESMQVWIPWRRGGLSSAGGAGWSPGKTLGRADLRFRFDSLGNVSSESRGEDRRSLSRGRRWMRA